MDTVHFLGRISPPSFNISIGNPQKLFWRIPRFDVMASFVVHIVNSQIDVECELEKFDNSYYIDLYFHAYDLARVSVDLAAFATGHSATTV